MASEGAFDRAAGLRHLRRHPLGVASVCKHIEWLKDRLSFRLSFIDNARGLREDVMALTNHSGSRNYMDIPVYLKGRDREGDGIER